MDVERWFEADLNPELKPYSRELKADVLVWRESQGLISTHTEVERQRKMKQAQKRRR